MKMYTEEQLQEAYNRGHMDGKLNNTDYSITDGFKPIELPTDEDIEKARKEQHLTMEEMCRFEEGVEWVIKQINNQNK